MKKAKAVVVQVVTAVFLAPSVVFARGRGGHIGRSEMFDAQSRALDNMEFGLKIMLIILVLMALVMLGGFCYDIFKFLKKRKSKQANQK
jgi:hypothetical protein